MSKTIRRSVRSARSSFAGESGMSIVQVMAGIILTAIIAAAGVFSTLAVIDWGQDNAAKTAIEDVRTAQEVYLTQTASEANGGSYGTIEQLTAAGLLNENTAVVTVVEDDDYAAAAKSKSGATFVLPSHDGDIVNSEKAGESNSALGSSAIDALK